MEGNGGCDEGVGWGFRWDGVEGDGWDDLPMFLPIRTNSQCLYLHLIETKKRYIHEIHDGVVFFCVSYGRQKPPIVQYPPER